MSSTSELTCQQSMTGLAQQLRDFADEIETRLPDRGGLTCGEVNLRCLVRDMRFCAGQVAPVGQLEVEALFAGTEVDA